VNVFTDSNDLPRFAELDAEYEILRELGRGGTAVVYLAQERELGRQVAIKVIRAQYVEDEEAAARLVREARTVGGLQHPNIVVLYGTRRLRDGSLALFMQYVPGRTLKAEIADIGPLPFERVRQILGDIGRALGYAHRHRIVHRDLKPENIYIDDDSGIARLSDFGIARPWDAESGLTMPGTAIGTPAYMSPEQIEGTPLDGRSDLYSLGIIGFEMLTGKRPWAGENLFNVIYKQKHEPLPRLDTLRPGIPDPLRRAVEGALAKTPDERWADADQFLAVLAGQDMSAPGTRAAAADVGNVATTDAAAGAQPAGGAAGRRAAGEKKPRPAAARPRRRKAVEPREPDPETVTVQYRRPWSETPPAAAPPGAQQTRRSPAGAAAGSPPSAALPTTAGVTAMPAHATVAPTSAELADVRRRTRRRVGAAALAIVFVGTAVSAVLHPWSQRADGAAAAAIGSVPAVEVTPPPEADAPAETGPAALMYAVLGADQQGAVGDTLAEPLMLRVEDAAGAALAGVPVRFTVIEGDGMVVPAEAVTDQSGTASARWAPSSAGRHRVEAALDGGRAVSFTATVVAAGPSRLAALSPTRLPTPEPAVLSVRAEDARGNAVAGAAVRFAVVSGDGAVEQTTVLTDSAGVASTTWTPGSTGAQRASARIEDVARTTVLFNAGTAGPARLPVRSGVAAGGTHTCALDGEGSLVCWGGNDRGQLGDGTTTRRQAPVRTATPEPFAAVASGVSHSCGLTTAGVAFCWGGNAAGQLGDGTQAGRSRPTRVVSDERFATIAAGTSHTCALNERGALFCWGLNAHGQLGDGTRANRTEPVRVGGSRQFRTIALGWSHTCAIGADGVSYCWGRNSSGQLGDGGTADRATPAPVAGSHRFAALAAGSAHTCGVRADSALLCWGQNDQGQLGNGTADPAPVPAPIRSDEQFSAVAAGAVHSCGLTRDGSAYCWGRNSYGQLGDGTTDGRMEPTRVVGGLRFAALAANGAHTCGSVTGSGWFCWGYNVDGQLGDGTRENQLRPTAAGRR
jgi:alpha-tubulin suppressor-like RCC1 family protein